jgi:hypothetical protein
MAGMSDYLENKLIDYLFRGQAFANPVIYIGLYTSAPTDAGGGAEVSTSGTNYGRIKAAAGSSMALTDWKSTQGNDSVSNGTGGGTSNTAAVTFGTPSGNWGQVTHFGIFDAQTNGNLLFWAALTNPKTVNNGDSAPSFAIAALTATLD